MNKSVKRNLKKYILITAVSVLYGAGTSLFLAPNDLVPGGLTGIAMILNRYVPLSVGVLFMIINKMKSSVVEANQIFLLNLIIFEIFLSNFIEVFIVF